MGRGQTSNLLSGPRGKLQRSKPRVNQVRESKKRGFSVWRRLSDGALHREDGPAIIEEGGGSKHWFLNSQRHREGGPAIEWAGGRKEWLLNGQRHREDGPAVVRANGSKEWFLNGKEYSEDKWQEELKKRGIN